ncbi:MAG: hypothetical protein AMK70_03080 [Nitrospira bacterium SG8_35_1]|nr:MAG: hypothetical protein AMK70_03080 [Nitrospira bacterium SG8_35_1]
MSKKILVVDDEKNIRLLLKEELQDEGYDVIMAENGATALEMIQKEVPDLVTLDIKMPGEDGLAVAADHYVTKSSDFSELKNKIQEILSYKS